MFRSSKHLRAAGISRTFGQVNRQKRGPSHAHRGPLRVIVGHGIFRFHTKTV
jgi:hypothetical protein